MKVKRIKFPKSYIGVTKDGLTFGMRTSHKGAHITLLEKDGRITLHKTMGDKRVNIYGAQKEETEGEFAKFDTLLRAALCRGRKPKYVYAVPNSFFTECPYMVKGKEAHCDICLPKNLKRVTYDEFLMGDWVFGATARGNPVIKTKSCCGVLTPSELCKFKRELFAEVPYFRALIETGFGS